jgi:hypothetical protein
MKHSLQVLIGLSVLVLAIAFAVHLTMTKPVKEVVVHGLDKSADVFTNTFHYGVDRFSDVITNVCEMVFRSVQPRVSVTASSCVYDASPIAELAVLKRNIREFVIYSRTDYYSTKRIVAEQTFVAKVGFDLAARFAVTYDPSNQVVVITMPNPKVLSLEGVTAAPTYDLEEQGVINWLTPEDGQQIAVMLKDQARKSADSALAVGDAKEMLATRFHDLFQAFQVKVVVVFPGQTNVMENGFRLPGNSREVPEP